MKELGTDHGFPLRFSAKAEQKPGNRGLSPIPPGLWNDSHWSERMSGAESRNRTDTVLPPPEFESGASTCSAISAI